jgi:hypothetical protein
MRFAVRLAGVKGLKIYGEDADKPVRFIEVHSRRQILHSSAHKKDKSPALVSIQSNWPSWSLYPLDDEATFTITVHRDNPEGIDTNDDAQPTTIPMEHTRCRPVTYQFTLPGHLLNSNTRSTNTTITTETEAARTSTSGETFEWRRSPTCTETRGIRKRTLPVLETGDERPPESPPIFDLPGAVLVRTTTKPTTATATTTTDSNSSSHTGPNRPLGYTRQGEEIVASWMMARDLKPRYYFQFWGAGATGELGPWFTHVAVLTGVAVYMDQISEERRDGDEIGGGRGGAGRRVHGVRSPVMPQLHLN